MRSNSNALSNADESEGFFSITGQILDISLPRYFDSNLDFLELIQFLFPCTVFISPLWHKYLNG